MSLQRLSHLPQPGLRELTRHLSCRFGSMARPGVRVPRKILESPLVNGGCTAQSAISVRMLQTSMRALLKGKRKRPPSWWAFEVVAHTGYARLHSAGSMDVRNARKLVAFARHSCTAVHRRPRTLVSPLVSGKRRITGHINRTKRACNSTEESRALLGLLSSSAGVREGWILPDLARLCVRLKSCHAGGVGVRIKVHISPLASSSYPTANTG